MLLNMKVRSPDSKKLKGIGVGRAREPSASQHTVAVPLNPLQQAGGLHSCLSEAGNASPPGPLPTGPGSPGVWWGGIR